MLKVIVLIVLFSNYSCAYQQIIEAVKKSDAKPMGNDPSLLKMEDMYDRKSINRTVRQIMRDHNGRRVYRARPRLMKDELMRTEHSRYQQYHRQGDLKFSRQTPIGYVKKLPASIKSQLPPDSIYLDEIPQRGPSRPSNGSKPTKHFSIMADKPGTYIVIGYGDFDSPNVTHPIISINVANNAKSRKLVPVIEITVMDKHTEMPKIDVPELRFFKGEKRRVYLFPKPRTPPIRNYRNLPEVKHPTIRVNVVDTALDSNVVPIIKITVTNKPTDLPNFAIPEARIFNDSTELSTILDDAVVVTVDGGENIQVNGTVLPEELEINQQAQSSLLLANIIAAIKCIVTAFTTPPRGYIAPVKGPLKYLFNFLANLFNDVDFKIIVGLYKAAQLHAPSLPSLAHGALNVTLADAIKSVSGTLQYLLPFVE